VTDVGCGVVWLVVLESATQTVTGVGKRAPLRTAAPTPLTTTSRVATTMVELEGEVEV
jgi:hypothetical protein